MKATEAMDHLAGQRRANRAGGAATLRHLQISEAENDGHVVEHHYENSGPGAYKEPVTHVFAAHDGKVKLPAGHVLTHIAKHMNIPHEVTNKERGIAEAPEPANRDQTKDRQN